MNSLELENKAISQLERRLMTAKRQSIYIALEEIGDHDFFWSHDEVEEFDFLYQQDKPLKEIAKEMRRSDMAVFLLSLDRVLRGILEPRKNWKFW